MTEQASLNTVKVNVNGKDYSADVPARRTLVDFLRYDLGLTGTKEACSVGVCGVCTVEVNGVITSSCITLAIQVDGAKLTTIEGVADGDTLHPLQDAFMNHGGFQCGICTPGQIMASRALLEQNSDPSEDEIKDWMMGNLCRCTGYYGIITSIQKAGEVIRLGK
jgi:carbon-monoxide dehydrogenase small subunit|tara:strand:+ start:2637 stop:3128 length:492 start_codon:yes stop_codon:yes gene_type:complete